MFRQKSMCSEDLHTEMLDIKIKKPSIITGLFPEFDNTICVPLDPPFDNFAITQHGEVFKFKPLKVMRLNDLRIINPDSLCVHKRKPNGRLYVVLPTPYQVNVSFFVDTLLMHYFKNEPLSNRLKIFYEDGDYNNLYISNLYTEKSWRT